MASIEVAPQVSVFALARDLRNGGNTPENRQQALKIVSQQADSSNFVYRNYLLGGALEYAWRKLGDTDDSKLDSKVLFQPETLAPVLNRTILEPAVMIRPLLSTATFQPLVKVA